MDPKKNKNPINMAEFKELQKELCDKAKGKNACQDQYNRAVLATNETELLKVIYDNINWCIENKCITTEYLEKFDHEKYLNSGIANTGKENTGFTNSGNWNSGDSNSGDSNSGYRNSGAFCTDNDPKAILFNKESSITVKEWERSRAFSLMCNLNFTFRVYANEMTDQEKLDNPKYETTEGYLKTISYKEGWANFWGNLNETDKKIFTNIENFDKDIFEEITGIKI